VSPPRQAALGSQFAESTTMTTITAPSAYVSSLIEFRAEKAVNKANKFAARAQAKADAAKVETKTFAGFSTFEKAEFLRHCRARYNSLAIEGFNWTEAFGLTSADFAGPLFERAQVEWLKARAALFAPLEEVFGA